MAKPILTDELCAAIEPLLPIHVPLPNGGHPRVSDRAALTGSWQRSSNENFNDYCASKSPRNVAWKLSPTK